MAIAEDIAHLERRLDELRIEYEHYFSGRSRIEPGKAREELQKLFSRWVGRPINNTMHKFRYLNLVARYNSLSTYWNRCVQAIEDGTFKRDRFRMQLHDRERKEKKARRKKLDGMIARRHGNGGAEEGLYREFLDARTACGQSASGVGREDFDAFLNRQRDAIRNRYKCDDVEFKVNVEGSRVQLIARPVKGKDKTPG